MVSVGILTAAEIHFEFSGVFMDTHNRQYGPGSFIARMQGGRMIIDGGKQHESADNQCSFTPLNREVPTGFMIRDVIIGIGFHWQKKENQVFLGALDLVGRGTEITVINKLPVEDYLISVISSEMKATSSVEMLKAHSVISRSWLLAQIEKSNTKQNPEQPYQSSFVTDQEVVRWYDREDHSEFDVCADDHCQRYQGITRISEDIVEQAVKATCGEVIVYNDCLCDARFSKCCGGVTELFENVWEQVNHPYLQKVYDHSKQELDSMGDLTTEKYAREWILSKPSAFCNTSDKKILSQVLNDYDQQTHDFYRWEVSYSAGELAALIRSKTGIDFGDILDIIPLQRGVSGRIIRLKICGTKKTMIIGKELEIRKALSATHLYSSAFIVEKTGAGDAFVFTLHGAGWGHGVGLCQIGAAVMGAQGYGYREILLHYFRGAELKQYKGVRSSAPSRDKL